MTPNIFCFKILTAKLYQVNSNVPCSPDSSSDSSTGSPHNPYIGPNPEAEACLPGVVLFLSSFANMTLIDILFADNVK